MTDLHEHPRKLPRMISSDCLWSGGCLETSYGKHTHSHFSMFVVKGTEKVILIDTGHPVHWIDVEKHVEEFLGGRKIDYIFLTHGEYPHAGLLSQWMVKYPEAIALGILHDQHLYHPEFSARLRTVAPGESVDLGGRHIVFVPAIWKDIPDSIWAFDTKDRILFAADGFAHLHPHANGECAALTSELSAPDIKLIQHFNERALHWTRYVDASETFADIDRLLTTLQPRFIAEAHGNVIDTANAMLPLFKKGMVTDNALKNLKGRDALLEVAR